MKKQINEIRRMQQLAGILKENQLDEFDNDTLNILYDKVIDFMDNNYSSNKISHDDIYTIVNDIIIPRTPNLNIKEITFNDLRKLIDKISNESEYTFIEDEDEDDKLDILKNVLKNLSLDDFIKVIKLAGDYNIWINGAKQMGTTLNDKDFRGETISTFEDDDIEKYNQALAQL